MLIFSGATLPYEVMPPVLQKVGGYFAFDTGDKAAESFIVRAADGVCVDSDCSKGSIHGHLRRDCDSLL